MDGSAITPTSPTGLGYDSTGRSKSKARASTAREALYNTATSITDSHECRRRHYYHRRRYYRIRRRHQWIGDEAGSGDRGGLEASRPTSHRVIQPNEIQIPDSSHYQQSSIAEVAQGPTPRRPRCRGAADARLAGADPLLTGRK
jgi:hypothetical protein